MKYMTWVSYQEYDPVNRNVLSFKSKPWPKNAGMGAFDDIYWSGGMKTKKEARQKESEVP